MDAAEFLRTSGAIALLDRGLATAAASRATAPEEKAAETLRQLRESIVTDVALAPCLLCSGHWGLQISLIAGDMVPPRRFTAVASPDMDALEQIPRKMLEAKLRMGLQHTSCLDLSAALQCVFDAPGVTVAETEPVDLGPNVARPLSATLALMAAAVSRTTPSAVLQAEAETLRTFPVPCVALGDTWLLANPGACSVTGPSVACHAVASVCAKSPVSLDDHCRGLRPRVEQADRVYMGAPPLLLGQRGDESATVGSLAVSLSPSNGGTPDGNEVPPVATVVSPAGFGSVAEVVTVMKMHRSRGTHVFLDLSGCGDEGSVLVQCLVPSCATSVILPPPSDAVAVWNAMLRAAGDSPLPLAPLPRSAAQGQFGDCVPA